MVRTIYEKGKNRKMKMNIKRKYIENLKKRQKKKIYKSDNKQKREIYKQKKILKRNKTENNKKKNKYIKT